MTRKRFMLTLVISLELAVIIPLSIALMPRQKTTRHISVNARKFEYSPSKIVVNKGDTIILNFSTSDVTHGFSLDGYPVELMARKGTSFRKISQDPGADHLKRNWERMSTVKFTAFKTGKFIFRCTKTCGNLHPFMTGEMIVKPNTAYHFAVSGSIWIFFSVFVAGFYQKKRAPRPFRINLFKPFPWFKKLVRLRNFQLFFVLLNLIVFYLFLLSSLGGSPVGNRNIAIVFVWILWWFVLKAIMVPFGGRVWCFMCPLPAPAEWLSRKRIATVRFMSEKYKTKSCYSGDPLGWACPWNQYMGNMNRNTDCGLCTECIKSCPKDNIGIFIRPFGSDRRIKGYDEVFNVIIMLTVAIIFSGVMLVGPWGSIKTAANVTESGNLIQFMLFLAVTWSLSLIIFPGIFLLCCNVSNRMAKKPIPDRMLIFKLVYILIPVGIFAWISFSLPAIMINYGYIISIVSDPLGLGWDLFNLAHLQFKPFLPEWIPLIQGIVLLTGLYVGLNRGQQSLRDVITEKKTLFLAMLFPSLFALACVNILLKILL